MLETREIPVEKILAPETRVPARRRTTLIVRPTAPDRYEVIVGWDAYDWALETAQATIPALVRISEPSTPEEQLTEHRCLNLLGPIEEARLFGEVMRATGLSQRGLARRYRIRQPHVSKRLSLLRLSRADQLRVEVGELTIDDALKLVRRRS